MMISASEQQLMTTHGYRAPLQQWALVEPIHPEMGSVI